MNLRPFINIIDEAEKGYANWDHEYPVEYSKHLEKTFGAPDELTDEQAVWHHKDGFKRIVNRDEYILHGSPAPHYDFIYCYIDLEVPEDMSDELAKCSGSILIDHLKNEVGARCGSLTANAVTLNFVLDVVAGRTEATKDEYEKRILSMREMFENGETYSNEWWEDRSKDADPNNPFYKDMEEQMDEGTRCWKGYERKGFKTMFGKRVPNCVKREDRYLVVDKFNEPVKLFDDEQQAVEYFKENYQLLDEEETPQSILAKFPKEYAQLKQGADLIDFDELYRELFDYFSATGEMPYGTQKARDGDPYVWIADELDDLGLLDESSHAGLRAWFGKGKKGGAGGGGWDRYNTKGERIGKCGDRKASEGKPKCLSKARAASLRAKGGKKAIAAAVRRKRSKDKNPERKGKAINVSNKPRGKK